MFKYEKYYIITVELNHPVKSFDEKLCICKTYYKHIYKNEIPYQAVCNKISLNPMPHELKKLKKIGKSFNFQENPVSENSYNALKRPIF